MEIEIYLISITKTKTDVAQMDQMGKIVPSFYFAFFVPFNPYTVAYCKLTKSMADTYTS